jgi:hypothetical protein
MEVRDAKESGIIFLKQCKRTIPDTYVIDIS